MGSIHLDQHLTLDNPIELRRLTGWHGQGHHPTNQLVVRVRRICPLKIKISDAVGHMSCSFYGLRDCCLI